MAALGVPLAVGYLLSWISALIGLTVRDPETAGTASLLPVIPLAFTSSTFVPVATIFWGARITGLGCLAPAS
jgi:hypothetical protein